MFLEFMRFLLKTLEVLFFIGLAGCVIVVAISWVSVSRASFKRGD